MEKINEKVRIVDLVEHSKELEKELFRTLTIRTDYYEKLEKILEVLNRRSKERLLKPESAFHQEDIENFHYITPQQFFEQFINDCYWDFKEKGEI